MGSELDGYGELRLSQSRGHVADEESRTSPEKWKHADEDGGEKVPVIDWICTEKNLATATLE